MLGLLGVFGTQQPSSGLQDAQKCRTGGFVLHGLEMVPDGAGERSG